MFLRFGLLLFSLSLLESCGPKSGIQSSDLDSVIGIYRPIPGDSAPPRPMVAVWKEGEGESTLYSAANCALGDIEPSTGACKIPIRKIVKQMTASEFKNFLFRKLEDWTTPDGAEDLEIAAVIKSFSAQKAWSQKMTIDKELSAARKKLDDQKKILGVQILTDPDFSEDSDVKNYHALAGALAELESAHSTIFGTITAIEVGFKHFLDAIHSNDIQTLKVSDPLESYSTLFLTLLNLTYDVHLKDIELTKCHGDHFSDGFAWIQCGTKVYFIDKKGWITYSSESKFIYFQPYSEGLTILNLSVDDYGGRETILINGEGKEVLRSNSCHPKSSFKGGMSRADRDKHGVGIDFLVDKNLKPVKRLFGEQLSAEHNPPQFSSNIIRIGFDPTSKENFYIMPDRLTVRPGTNFLGDFYNDKAMIWTKGKNEVDVIDLHGGKIRTISIPFEVSDVRFSADLAFIKTKEDTNQLLVTSEGVTSKWFDAPDATICENGWYLWSDSSKRKLMNPDTLLELAFPTDAIPVGCFSKENLAPVKIGGKYTYITTSGELAWGGQKTFTAAEVFSDGLAYVETDTERGYISSTGDLYLRFTNKIP